MRTITLDLYSFNELAEKIRAKVLDKMRYLQTEDNWWEQDYEDAEQIGLKITGFNPGTGTITGRFIWRGEAVAKAIIKNHGENCDTYKTAKYFLDVDLPKVEFIPLLDGSKGDERDYMDVIDEFQVKLLAHYSVMLSADYEYITSNKAVREMIEAEGYEFFVNGERYNKNKFGGEDK